LAVVLLTSDLPAWRLAVGLGSLVVFLAAWALFARQAKDGNPPAVALTIITIVVAAVGTAAQPSFATIQCLAYPMVWVLAADRRRALIGNVALSLAVGGGFLFSRGTDQQELFEIALTVALSLAFSM